MKNEARTIALRTISIFKIHLVNEKRLRDEWQQTYDAI